MLEPPRNPGRFNTSVDEYVESHIFKHVQNRMSLQYGKQAAHQANDLPLVAKLTNEFDTERNWFDNELQTLKERMRPFLQLEH